MRNEKGFTLVEVMWVFSLMVIVIIAIYAIYSGSMNLYYMTSEQGIAQGEARKAMRTMTQVLRGMMMISDVDNVNGLSITILSDIDDDKKGETVRFSADSTNLVYTLVDDDDSFTLAQFVRNQELGIPLFRFYDRDGELISDKGSIIGSAFSVEIRLIVDVTADFEATAENPLDINAGIRPERYELLGKAQFRNREI